MATVHEGGVIARKWKLTFNFCNQQMQRFECLTPWQRVDADFAASANLESAATKEEWDISEERCKKCQTQNFDCGNCDACIDGADGATDDYVFVG